MHTMRRRKANSIGLIMRKSSLVKHITEGNIELTGRRGKRSKHLLIEIYQLR